MATERQQMRKIREVLRLKWELKKSHREVALALGVSAGGVGEILRRAAGANVSPAMLAELSDEALEAKLYGAPSSATRRALPDPAWIHLERRRPGVTLELLHLEYLQREPNGYRYTQFCQHYRDWLGKRGLTMRQEHRAGEKLFVDYSGKKLQIVNAETGESVDVELFVAVLGASNLVYAEATLTQRGPDFIASNGRALEFIDGVPGAIVPDQLKSGVTRSCIYEPEVQATYAEFARHYGTAIVPARPGHPRDKAKVEVGVQVVQRWILARLRNRRFFSLDELNDAIAELLIDLNDRPMRLYGESRRALFDRLEKSALRPLPAQRFEYGVWKQVRVNIDYHVEVDHHFYSVPFTYAREAVEAWATATNLEIFRRGVRIASHTRSMARGRHTTDSTHMPKSHRAHAEWTPSRLQHWASGIGPQTAALITAILEERRHPEQGYRSCLGILRLAKRHGAERLEAACARGVAVRARSYRNIKSILEHGLEAIPTSADGPAASPPVVVHENVRGGGYYN